MIKKVIDVKVISTPLIYEYHFVLNDLLGVSVDTVVVFHKTEERGKTAYRININRLEDGKYILKRDSNGNPIEFITVGLVSTTSMYEAFHHVLQDIYEECMDVMDYRKASNKSRWRKECNKLRIRSDYERYLQR